MVDIRAVQVAISRFLIGILVAAIAFSAFFSVVEAEVLTQQYTCPIESFPSISVSGMETLLVTDGTVLSSATISNQTNYSIGGVRVGIALFEKDGVYPKYWTVLPGAFQLFPYSTIEVPLDFNLKNVALGGYEARLVAVQGDEVAVLGALLNNQIPKVSGVILSKQTNAVFGPVISLKVADEVTKESQTNPFTVKAEVKNEDSLPLLDSKVVVVVSEGFIPLGAAVRAEKTAAVTLVPASTQATILRNVKGGAGEHTVYAGLITEGVLQPIEHITISLPGEHEGRWSYISRVGLSDYPLDEEAEVVACVDVVGEEPGTADFSEELGVTFTVRDQGSVLAEETVYSSDVSTHGFIRYRPGVEATNLLVETDLLQLRFPSYVESSDEVSFEDIVRGQLVPVQTLSQAFVCRAGENCDGYIITAGEVGSAAAAQKPFWFYAGIVIAAALLMYLMLRRLPGGRVETAASSKELSTSELQ